MSSQQLYKSAIQLLFLVLLVIFVPVLHSTKAPKAPNKFTVPSDRHYLKASGSTASSESSNWHKNASSSSSSSISSSSGSNSKMYSRKSGNVVKSRHNSVVASETLQGTLLKVKAAESREENLHRFNSAVDMKNTGVKSYKKRYPTPKPRKHYIGNNHEMGNRIHRRPDKYPYSKDSRKHNKAYHQHKIELSKEHRLSSYHHAQIAKAKTTTTISSTISSFSKTIPPSPTPETIVKEYDDSDDSDDNDDNDNTKFSNLSEQIDFDLSEASNSSLSNESSSSNSSSDSEKSNFNRCATCRMRDGDRRYRIEKLKQTILSSLHMAAPPNTSKVPIPKMPALTSLYNMDDDMMNDSPYNKRTNNMYDDEFTVKTERVFTKARQPPAQVQLNISDSLYFAPPINLYTCKIKTAYLWFYIRKQDIRRPYIHLTIERILAESVPAKRLITKTIFSQKLLRDRAFGWKRIDLRNILRRWVTHPMSNHGLQIRAYDDKGNNLVVLTPSAEVDSGYEPWLDTKVLEQKSSSRHRRSTALRCTESSTEGRCCRYPLYITFAEFGWEWIIAPTRVKADYCSGECEMTMQNVYAVGWLHQQVPGNSGSCCTPTKLAALPLLYFDEDYNVLYQVLQNMKVMSCGCV